MKEARGITHMLAKRMRQAERDLDKQTPGTPYWYEAQARWIEANNSYNIASQILCNYKDLYSVSLTHFKDL